MPLVCREKITACVRRTAAGVSSRHSLALPALAIIRVESDFPSDALDMAAEGEESIDVEETNEIGG